MKRICSIAVCVLPVLAIVAAQAGATLPFGGMGGWGSFRGSLTYTCDHGTGQATLEVVLTNTSSPADGGHITGFALNNPGGNITGVALPDSVFSLLGAPAFANGVSVRSIGVFDIGLALGGKWEGDASRGGIEAGQTRRFTFLLTGSNLQVLREGYFLGEPALGSHHYFAVRFVNIEKGESITVPADEIAPLTLSSFTATGHADRIELAWTSRSEMDVLAYHLYRGQTEDGQLAEIARLEARGSVAGSRDYHYSDDDVVPGKKYYYYKLAAEHFAGEMTFHGPVFAAASSSVPRQYGLLPAFPNPFNASTAIGYQQPSAGQVTLTIFDVLGRKARTLVDGHQKAGSYTVSWDGKDSEGHDLKSGVYFCIFEARKFSETMKLTLTR